jgi:tetratricopeptide (TPR) repeat protein
MDGGDFRGARPLAEKCLADAEALGNADQHLEARFDLAWCDFYMGRWAQAYRGLTTMLQLARFVGDQGRETMARAWLGIFLAAAGDFDSAIAYGKDALATALSRGDRRSELYAQLALADAYTGLAGRESEARYHMNQALAVTMALRHERGEIECRLRIARLSAQIGDLAELRDSTTRALALARRLGARHLECLALCWLAQLGVGPQTSDAAEAGSPADSAPDTPPSALDFARKALEIAQEIELAEGQWRARWMLAELTSGLSANSRREAETYLRDAIALLETLRAALRAAGLADTLLEDREPLTVYARLIQRLQQEGRTEEAAQLLDQAAWPPLASWLEANADTDTP